MRAQKIRVYSLEEKQWRNVHVYWRYGKRFVFCMQAIIEEGEKIGNKLEQGVFEGFYIKEPWRFQKPTLTRKFDDV